MRVSFIGWIAFTIGCGARTGFSEPGRLETVDDSGTTTIAEEHCGPLSNPVVTLASNQHGPSYVAFDDTFVYWAQSQTPGNEIMRVEKTGGTPTIVSTQGFGAYGIARADDRVYWVVYDIGSTLYSAPASGGSASVVWKGGRRSTDLRVDSDVAYVLSTGTFPDYVDGSIDAIDIATGVSHKVAEHLVGARNLVHDAGLLYWVEGNEDASIKTTSTSGGTVSTLVRDGRIGGMVVDATHVYWVSGGRGIGEGSLFSIPRAGGVPTKLADSFASQRLATDAYCVYGDGILRVAKTGGTPARSANPGAVIAMDDRRIYWTRYDAPGAVLSLEK